MQLNDTSTKEKVLSVQDLTVVLNNEVILNKVNLDIYRGDIVGIIGPSGVGKSILMRAIIGLIPHVSGTIKILKEEFLNSKEKIDFYLGTKLGVLFQHGALFSSMSVHDNISVPIRQNNSLPESIISDIVKLKMSMVGLPIETASLSPYQLSGGMIKRVALARSLAIDPELIFLDEPTSGLDPIGASEFDKLLVKLRNSLGLTVYMITHDINSLMSTCNRVIVMVKNGIIYNGNVKDMLSSDYPWVKSYLTRLNKDVDL
ncbi:ABC transporter ATP-binding protein [Candidatus Liberibacter americanus]|uniref:Methionine ABC transporter ATP-binding protein n=1 Tax=Candidatus Liberibacter americanus str. Sao Paulo TaxID=1261131 RepID=U6B438_9HYPH|nr:ATP-binding cassette domain-containing protein [Candidatus Liberibacter americanus]AHA27824.1 Methionine ABC transporter ATP-binding protein [Candidatus Liberibacter americanus str. Sao Paulo]EMS35991.1 ATP-binding component of ABC transporter [Candidatus Liberibacter americanus PW_SP]